MAKILRTSEVIETVGLSRATIWRRRREGSFPIPVDLGGGFLGWLDSDISEWIESRPRLNIETPRTA